MCILSKSVQDDFMRIKLMSITYKARARPRRLKAPARLMATSPVAMGAPPVEVAEVGEDDLDEEAIVCETEAVVSDEVC